VVNRSLERGDSGLRSFASVQSALVMYPIHGFRLRRAETAIGCRCCKQGKAIGWLWPDRTAIRIQSGGMLTTRREKGESYVLDGEKMWITNGSIADVALIWAKCEDAKIRGFLVEKGTAGFKAWTIHGKQSLRRVGDWPVWR